MTRRTLSVVIPVYCNAESLPELHQRLSIVASRLGERAVDLQIIFVDDGSTDDSRGILNRIAADDSRVCVIALTRNFGAVQCSKAGLRYVQGEAFVIMAADLQDPPELLDELVDRWLTGAQFVICERISRDDPVFTRLFAWLYYRLLRILVAPGFPVGGFDMALMDRDMLAPLRDSAKTTYTPILAYWLGYQPEVIQYHRPRRRHGLSKWTFAKKFNAFLDVFFGFSVKPLRAVTFIGGVIALLAMAYGVLVAANALFGRVDSVGFPTLVAMIAFLSGIQIIAIGVIGEYLWRTLDQVNQRPGAIVQSEYFGDASPKA